RLVPRPQLPFGPAAFRSSVEGIPGDSRFLAQRSQSLAPAAASGRLTVLAGAVDQPLLAQLSTALYPGRCHQSSGRDGAVTDSATPVTFQITRDDLLKRLLWTDLLTITLSSTPPPISAIEGEACAAGLSSLTGNAPSGVDGKGHRVGIWADQAINIIALDRHGVLARAHAFQGKAGRIRVGNFNLAGFAIGHIFDIQVVAAQFPTVKAGTVDPLGRNTPAESLGGFRDRKTSCRER